MELDFSFWFQKVPGPYAASDSAMTLRAVVLLTEGQRGLDAIWGVFLQKLMWVILGPTCLDTLPDGSF